MPPANKRGQHLKDAREAKRLQALASVPSEIEQSAFSSGSETKDNTFSNLEQAGEELQISDSEEVTEDRAAEVTLRLQNLAVKKERPSMYLGNLGRTRRRRKLW